MNDNDNSISIREMYRGVDYDFNTFQTEREGKSLTVFGERFNYGYDLFEIDEFGKQVASDETLGFIVSVNDKGNNQIKELALGRYFPMLNAWSGTFYRYAPSAFLSAQVNTNPEWENLPTFTFSPHVTAVFDSFREMGLLHETFTKPIVVHRPGVNGADLFNALIMRVRDKTKSEEFRKRVKTVEANYRRNQKSYTKYFNALLDKWSRLLVLRLDFFFPKDQTNFITVEQAHAARERFLNNTRANKLFADLVGGIWKLEWGNDRGHHFHFILFFDGATRKQEKWIAEQIGKYWVEKIAPGGSYNSCHRDPNQYKRRGIGMINHDDALKREIFLSHVLGYLIKQDQCLMVRPSKGRSIGRMEMPKERTTAAGRPRKPSVAIVLQR